ncbi:ArdC family protein [Vibrio mediterranei]|uniref:ArdC family protein n=1 Tax=Vibrio mediterranei TaxID=689 RepID=UPI00148D2653|nr:zincin-like metallopeptidase domain-containing protein [Vibrio mediterranei]NOI26692.1 DUF1738 domain-containing protein [Vibrio mediterranei]
MKKVTDKKQMDIYQVVTDRIIEALEKGVKPWECPWDESGISSLPKNFTTHANYQGVNILLLWDALYTKGFLSNQWLTFNQAKKLGGNIRKGEKSTRLIKYNVWEKEEENQHGELVQKHCTGITSFCVFNIEQTEGIEYETPTQPEPTITACDWELFQHVQEAIDNTGASIQEKGVRAFYRPSTDEIVMPEKYRFSRACDYFATLTHELTHWSGNKNRLNRLKNKKFGSRDYAFEELVAELGSAFLMAEFGFTGELQHASYIESWLQALGKDKTYIIHAASLASEAHQFIMQYQHKNSHTQKAA